VTFGNKLKPVLSLKLGLLCPMATTGRKVSRNVQIFRNDNKVIKTYPCINLEEIKFRIFSVI
jgi:hypothetical protein